MYNDMYNTFKDVKFTYNYLYSFDKRNQPYLEMIDKADNSWEYGSQVILNVPTEIELIDSDVNYLKLNIYNFRYEQAIYLESKIVVGKNAIFILNEDDSKLLIPNIYYYSLHLIKLNEDKELLGINSEHFFYVKDKQC